MDGKYSRQDRQTSTPFNLICTIHFLSWDKLSPKKGYKLSKGTSVKNLTSPNPIVCFVLLTLIAFVRAIYSTARIKQIRGYFAIMETKMKHTIKSGRAWTIYVLDWALVWTILGNSFYFLAKCDKCKEVDVCEW